MSIEITENYDFLRQQGMNGLICAFIFNNKHSVVYFAKKILDLILITSEN